jgi:hypothetical protein
MSVPTSTISPRAGSISDDGSIFAFDGAEALLRAWGGGLKPDPQLTVSEWADRYRTLSSRAAAEPGRYRTKRTPYMKDIMDALSPGHRASRVVFMKAAQVGATEAGNCFLGFIIHQAPGPALAVQPTVELAKRNSRQRIDASAQGVPGLDPDDPRAQPHRARVRGQRPAPLLRGLPALRGVAVAEVRAAALGEGPAGDRGLCLRGLRRCHRRAPRRRCWKRANGGRRRPRPIPRRSASTSRRSIRRSAG